MVELHEINVTLSEKQKTHLKKAFLNRETITLSLSKDALNGRNTLYVPLEIFRRWVSNRAMNEGMEIKLAGTNIRKQVCGTLFLSPILTSCHCTL